jgi:hypothetical protein
MRRAKKIKNKNPSPKNGGNEATIKAQLQQHNHITFVIIENANDESRYIDIVFRDDGSHILHDIL